MIGEGNGNPLQYSCLENSMFRGAWQATVPGVEESDTTEVTQQAGTRIGLYTRKKKYNFSVVGNSIFLKMRIYI